jgi:hypothetical protein
MLCGLSPSPFLNMKHILTLILTLAMASLTVAQNIGLVTDTNGNIITGRTNELTFTNNLRFGPLTNANAQTAIIGTNGALSAGSVPSGAAANGALLTADGAGSSVFVAPKAITLKATNVASATDGTANAIAALSWTVAANTTYRITTSIYVNQQAGGYEYRLQMPSALFYTNATNTQGLGVSVVGNGNLSGFPVWAATTNVVRILNRGGASLPQTAFSTFVVTSGTNGGTAEFQFGQNSSNATATTLINAVALIEEL